MACGAAPPWRMADFPRPMPMPRWIKRLLIFGALAMVVVAGGGALAVWLAVRQITPERIVHELEASCNARVQLDGCGLSLFSSPARLELTGLHFHLRDGEADRATPPASRPPIKIGNTYVRMRRGVVEADLAALLFRREIKVRSLLIEMGDVKCDILPGGGNSLRDLFRSPATVAGRPNAATVALAPVAAAIAVAAQAAADSAPPAGGSAVDDAAGDTSSDADENQPDPLPEFHARDLPGPIAIDRLTLVESRVRIRNRKTRGVTELNQLHLSVTGLAIDPARLADAGRAEVALRSRIWVDGGRKNPGRLAELDVSVEGGLALFDAATGRLHPDLHATAVIAAGATLRSLPALEKIEKNLARARRAGLHISPLATEAVLATDASLPLLLSGHRLGLAGPATLDFTDYALVVETGGMLDFDDDTHDVAAAWIASQAISDKALAGADEFLGALGDDVAAELRRLLIDPLVKNNRIHMDFTSRGELAKPDVNVLHPLKDITDQIKDTGRGLLDRLKEN